MANPNLPIFPFPPMPPPLIPGMTLWKAAKTETGDTYFYNVTTRATAWQLPFGAVLDEPAAKVTQPDASPAPKAIAWDLIPGTNWKRVKTNENEYYYVNSETNETQWEVPTDAGVSEGIEMLDMPPEDLPKYEPEPVEEEEVAVEEEEEEEQLREVKKPRIEEQEEEEEEEPELEEVDSKWKDLPEEERKDLFMQLLRENDLNKFSVWEKELPKMVFDRRFTALVASQRREVFEDYVINRLEKEKKEEEDQYFELLDEWFSRSDFDPVKASFTEFNEKNVTDTRLIGDSDKGRRLFKERLKPLLDDIKKERNVLRQAYWDYLATHAEFNARISWKDAKDLLHDVAEFKNVKSRKERERIFRKFRDELIAKRDEIAKQRREEEDRKYYERMKLKTMDRKMRERHERAENEARKRQERLKREVLMNDYRNLLAERIKDPDASWRRSQSILEKDIRFPTDLPENDRERLFRDHCEKLWEDRKKDYADFVNHVGVDIDVTFEQFEEKHSDSVGLSDSTERKRIFNSYIEKRRSAAIKEFVEFLKDFPTQISASTPTEGPEFENMKIFLRDAGTKVWGSLNSMSQERDELLRKHILDLRRRMK